MKEWTEYGAATGTEQERQEMIRFGIRAETKTVYSYQGYVYERLQDALAYAGRDTARRTGQGADEPANSA